MILATWNVNSVRVRTEHILKYLDRQPVDVLCLQELKCRDEDFPREPLESAGYHAIIAGQKTYNGVAVLAREAPQDPVVGLPHLPADHPLNAHRRLLAVTLGGVRVISAYLPNGEAVGSDKYSFKLAFFAELRAYMEAEAERHGKLCLLGDFNIAPEDRDVYDPAAFEGQVPCSEPERTALEALREAGRFEDCFRKHNDEGELYSWWDYRGGSFWKNRGVRIDHVWATPELAATCTACEVDLSPRKWKKPSDHAPVRAVFEV